MRGVMIQGTASDVGKSLIVTALCRLFANEGLKVAPFKSQNMSNNSYVTVDGKEIGRAQGIQAEAAGVTATVAMNPILLKPRSDQQSEIVLLGKAIETLSGHRYRESFYEKGLETIEKSLEFIKEEFDLIVVEGAGSPVEINLKDRELVNMKVAELADLPVILVADIDRGGVFASIVGTLELFSTEERARVKGIIINKFRGDIGLFEDGKHWIEERTGIPVLGILPHIHNHLIDSEDSLSIDQIKSVSKNAIDLAVIQLPFISNFSDIEPFLLEEDVSVRWVKHPSDFGEPDAVIIPGTKSTINDLKFLKSMNLHELIYEFVDRGGFLAGLCGGYQMLGEEIIDEAGSDTGLVNKRIEGLGLIPAKTVFYREKETVRVIGRTHPATKINLNQPIEGYEIHLGRTSLNNHTNPFLELENGRDEGYFSDGRKVLGTYIHHLFHNDEWRGYWLNMIRKSKGIPQREVLNTTRLKEERYERLASNVKEHLDWDSLKQIVNEWGLNHEVY